MVANRSKCHVLWICQCTVTIYCDVERNRLGLYSSRINLYDFLRELSSLLWAEIVLGAKSCVIVRDCLIHRFEYSLC